MTGAVQEKMRAGYSTKAHAMMLAVNKWSALYLGVAIVFTGEIFRFVASPIFLWTNNATYTRVWYGIDEFSEILKALSQRLFTDYLYAHVNTQIRTVGELRTSKIWISWNLQNELKFIGDEDFVMYVNKPISSIKKLNRINCLQNRLFLECASFQSEVSQYRPLSIYKGYRLKESESLKSWK